MKGKIRMVIMSLVIIFIIGAVAPMNVQAASKGKAACKRAEKSIRKKYKEQGKVKFYDTENLTLEMLLNRKGTGKIIVERCVGVVVNSNGDGKFKADNGKYYYICYAGWVKNCKKGMKVVSYFVYNKDTNYTDDIIERYDVVVKCKGKL